MSDMPIVIQEGQMVSLRRGQIERRSMWDALTFVDSCLESSLNPGDGKALAFAY